MSTLQTDSVFSPHDINTTINHEPRMQDLRLATALGYKTPRQIRPVIKRNIEQLERLGGLSHSATNPTTNNVNRQCKQAENYFEDNANLLESSENDDCPQDAQHPQSNSGDLSYSPHYFSHHYYRLLVATKSNHHLTDLANQIMVPMSRQNPRRGLTAPMNSRRSARQNLILGAFLLAGRIGASKGAPFSPWVQRSVNPILPGHPFDRGSLGLLNSRRRAMSTLQTESVFSPRDINTTINHEPRMQDLRLAEALGFSDIHKIRNLIERHRKSLNRFGELISAMVAENRKRGRPGKEYWLNKKQCLYLCAKSETANATDITIQMVEVFDQVSGGTLRTHVERSDAQVRSKRRNLNRITHWQGKLAECEAQLRALDARKLVQEGREKQSRGYSQLALRPAAARPSLALTQSAVHPAWRDVCALFAACDALEGVEDAGEVRAFLERKAITRLRGADMQLAAAGWRKREVE